MRISGVIRKSLKEQSRSLWLLILTVVTAPFFVIIYDLITESSAPVYDILAVNLDGGIIENDASLRLGDSLIITLTRQETRGWKIVPVPTREAGEKKLKNRKADVLMIVPVDFSKKMTSMKMDNPSQSFDLEFIGNITDMNYVVGSILTYRFVSDFVIAQTGIKPSFNFIETPLGVSGQLTDFEMAVPGLLVFSIIMLMLTASVAMVAEVENKTMLRLKLSGITTLELMGGITLVQIVIGFISVFLTLGLAAALGFRFQGSMPLVFLIVLLTTISIIAFSLFIAAFSKSVTQVLIVGNFPLFIFMFFTGAMFPMQVTPWFSPGGYPVSLISLMSPTHAVSALTKILVMQQSFSDVLPEIISIVLLCILYFTFGMGAYRRQHMR